MGNGTEDVLERARADSPLGVRSVRSTRIILKQAYCSIPIDYPHSMILLPEAGPFR